MYITHRSEAEEALQVLAGEAVLVGLIDLDRRVVLVGLVELADLRVLGHHVSVLRGPGGRGGLVHRELDEGGRDGRGDSQLLLQGKGREEGVREGSCWDKGEGEGASVFVRTPSE